MTALADPDRAQALGQEWQALFRAHECYEFGALALKLSALVLCGLAWGASWLWVLLPLLWLQEGVLKTFQSRLSDRLLRVEQLLRGPASTAAAFQLHSEWLKQRPGSVALMLEYLKSALRPTVALPYPVLLLALAFV